MNVGDIAFPNLGIYLENFPKSFTVFGFEIALYGVFMGLAILAGILLADYDAKATGQNPDIYWDFFIYAVIFSVIGARIYYVVFAWDFFKDDPLSIFNIRNGGLGFYGSMIGAILTLLIFAKIKKQNVLQMGDTGAMALILGQAIGRWGNFANREVFGEYTNNPFAMRLPIEAVRGRDITENLAAHIGVGENFIQVHPTFLYESAWNLMILALMLLYRKHKKFHGEICLIYFAGYGLGRFLIEGIRTDVLLIPGTQIAISQVVSLCMIAFAVVAEVVARILIKQGKLQPYKGQIATQETTELTE